MKKNELTDLRKKEIGDLEKRTVDLKHQIQLSYAKMKAGQEKNFKKVKNLKKDLAQTLTIIREKEIIKQSENKNILKKK